MTSLGRFSLVLGFAILARSPAQARVFEPLPPPLKLVADEQTLGLWEFSQEAMAKGQLLNLGRQGSPGSIAKVRNSSVLRNSSPIIREQGGFSAGRSSTASDAPDRSIVSFSELGVAAARPLHCRCRIALASRRRSFLKIGAEPNALLMGALNRGPGLFELRVPVKTADGSTKVEVLASNEIFRDASPIPARRILHLFPGLRR